MLHRCCHSKDKNLYYIFYIVGVLEKNKYNLLQYENANIYLCLLYIKEYVVLD